MNTNNHSHNHTYANSYKNNSNKSNHNMIDQSTISYINSTLPITNNSLLPHFNSNILA